MRTGKIARLPRTIRDQLNVRLDDGESAPTLLQWLNSLEDVQRALREHYEGRPISEQNLTEWRRGGFIDWLRHQEACGWVRTVVGEDGTIAETAGLMPFSNHLSSMAALTVGRLLRDLSAGPLTDPAETKELVVVLRELARLRKEDRSGARLRMDLEAYQKRQDQEQLGKQAASGHLARSHAPAESASLPAQRS